jgi:hypothetical protein
MLRVPRESSERGSTFAENSIKHGHSRKVPR